MPHRTFTDGAGAAWDVWDVIPRGPAALGTAVLLPAAADSSTSPTERRLHVAPELRAGWLAFRYADGTGAPRRLAPIPPGWAAATDAELARLCALALPVPARRAGAGR